MMNSKLITDTFKQNVVNGLGWKTRRKIVVIESDDWGAIRMSSKDTFDRLQKSGVGVDDPYNRNDALESSEELTSLFELLSGIRTDSGSNPVITANYLVANPDFERIKAGNFEHYFFEPITTTYKRFPQTAGALELILTGSDKGFFQPQFHGREHLNVPVWMEALRTGHKETLLAFESGIWGQTTSYPNARRRHFMAAFDFRSLAEEQEVCAIAADGLRVFESTFYRKSASFIAPNYVWSEGLEKVLAEFDCSCLQGQRNQLTPIIGKANCRPRFHFTGQKNKLGQLYLVRNAWFEPSSNQQVDWVDRCLNDVRNAFRWMTPAIISSHRANYIGSINPVNRDRNLPMLAKLMREIIKCWPCVEFMTSDQLGDEIVNG